MTATAPQFKHWETTHLHTAHVTSVDDEHLTLDDGAIARIAVSCFISPQVGDLVSYLEADSCYVLHVLRRPADQRTARVALPGIDSLQFAAKELALQATSRLTLTSLVDCEVVAATGRLSLSAQNLISQASDSMVQLAEQVVTRAENISQTARHLLAAQARRHWIVAEKEVRVDGELIQMG